MKFSYQIHPEKRVIFQKYSGRFSLQDLMSAAQQLWTDPEYSREFNGLVDLTSGSVFVSIDDFRAFAQFVFENPQTSGGRWAAVTSSPLATACAFVYKKMLATRHDFEVFSTWEAACLFVDVKPSELAGIASPEAT